MPHNAADFTAYEAENVDPERRAGFSRNGSDSPSRFTEYGVNPGSVGVREARSPGRAVEIREVDKALRLPSFKCPHCSWATSVEGTLGTHIEDCIRRRERFKELGTPSDGSGVTEERVREVVRETVGSMLSGLKDELREMLRPAPAKGGPKSARSRTHRGKTQARGRESYFAVEPANPPLGDPPPEPDQAIPAP